MSRKPSQDSRELKPGRQKLAPFKITRRQADQLAALVPAAHRATIRGFGRALSGSRRPQVTRPAKGKLRMRHYIELEIDPQSTSDMGTATGIGPVGLYFKHFIVVGSGMFEGMIAFSEGGGAFFHVSGRLPAGATIQVFLGSWGPGATASVNVTSGTMDPPPSKKLTEASTGPTFSWRAVTPVQNVAGCIVAGFPLGNTVQVIISL